MDEDIVGKVFPNGIRLMAVDDDPTCLKMVEVILSSCSCYYKVTTCANPCSALSILRERRGEFDLLLTDVHMPEMSGFQLLKVVANEMDLPIILMSVDTDMDMMTKGLELGACHYLAKPLNIHQIKNIWQYVVLKRGYKGKALQISEMPALEDQSESRRNYKGKNVIVIEDESDHDSNNPNKGYEGVSSSNLTKKKNDTASKQKRKKDDFVKEGKDSPRPKKSNMHWTPYLQFKFLDAVRQLDKDAYPSKITKVMNVKGIRRQHVASHLQKHRIRVTKDPMKSRISLRNKSIFDMVQGFSNDQLPYQYGLVNTQSSCRSTPIPNTPMFMTRIGQSHLQQINSSTSCPPMANLSYIESCLNRLRLNETNRANSYQGTSKIAMTPQGSNVYIPNTQTNLWNNFSGGVAGISGSFRGVSQPPQLNNCAQVYYNGSEFPNLTLGLGHYASIGPSSNNICPTQYNAAWDENYLRATGFTASSDSRLVGAAPMNINLIHCDGPNHIAAADAASTNISPTQYNAWDENTLPILELTTSNDDVSIVAGSNDINPMQYNAWDENTRQDPKLIVLNDNALIGAALNNISPMDYEVSDGNALQVPEFTTSNYSVTANGLASVETQMGTNQSSTVDFGPQHHDVPAVGSSSKKVEDDDFVELLEKFIQEIGEEV